MLRVYHHICCLTILLSINQKARMRRAFLVVLEFSPTKEQILSTNVHDFPHARNDILTEKPYFVNFFAVHSAIIPLLVSVGEME